jgi:hypothetical protein
MTPSVLCMKLTRAARGSPVIRGFQKWLHSRCPGRDRRAGERDGDFLNAAATVPICRARHTAGDREGA